MGKDQWADPDVRKSAYEVLGQLTQMRDAGRKRKLSTGTSAGKGRLGKMWAHC